MVKKYKDKEAEYHIVNVKEESVDAFINEIQKRKPFDGENFQANILKNCLGHLAWWALNNQSYFEHQITPTEHRDTWSRVRHNIMEEAKTSFWIRGFITAHMGLKTDKEKHQMMENLKLGNISETKIKANVNSSLSKIKSTQGRKGKVEFDRNVIKILLDLYEKHQMSSDSKFYPAGRHYSAHSRKRKPSRFSKFCDLFYHFVLNIDNLNSHDSDIITNLLKSRTITKA